MQIISMMRTLEQLGIQKNLMVRLYLFLEPCTVIYLLNVGRVKIKGMLNETYYSTNVYQLSNMK